MSEFKVNLTISLQGSKMLSERKCSKQLKKGKKIETVPVVENCDRNSISFFDSKKQKRENITFYTRKSETVKQVINLTIEAYEYMISNEVPYGFKVAKGGTHWKNLSKKQKLEWHLNAICEGVGGSLLSYTVFDD